MTAPQQSAASASPRTLPVALLTWLVVAGLLALVVVLVGIRLAEGTTKAPTGAVGSAPASVVSAVTTLPGTAFDAVGAPAQTGPLPQVLGPQPPLDAGGHPVVAFAGAEFSPYNALASWALVTALARVGTWSDLGETHSAPTLVFGRLDTFSLDGAKYRSIYVTLRAAELYGDALSATTPAGYVSGSSASGALESALRRYDDPAGGVPVLPFIDVDNQVVLAGSQGMGSPGVLTGLSMQAIAAQLSDPTTPVALAVLGEANEISAAICASDGEQPAVLCASAAVRAGAARLGLG
ncbi:MAG: DUF929 family protein [Acidimicrobiales bacterium]